MRLRVARKVWRLAEAKEEYRGTTLVEAKTRICSRWYYELDRTSRALRGWRVQRRWRRWWVRRKRRHRPARHLSI